MDLRADFGSRHSMLSFETHLPLNSAASMAFCEPAKLITNKYIYITVMHDCAHEYTRSTIYIYYMCVCCIIYWLMLSVYFYEIFIYIFIYWFIYCFIKYFFKYISYVYIYIYRFGVGQHLAKLWPLTPQNYCACRKFGKAFAMYGTVRMVYNQFSPISLPTLLQKNVTQCD